VFPLARETSTYLKQQTPASSATREFLPRNKRPSSSWTHSRLPVAIGSSKDKLGGALPSRPQLDRALGELRAGDTLVVWKLDRLESWRRKASTVCERRALIEVLRYDKASF